MNNAQEVNTKNGEIIATLQQLASQLPAQSDTINSALAKLSEQNQSNQQLISSLTAGNDGISNALSTTTKDVYKRQIRLFSATGIVLVALFVNITANVYSFHDVMKIYTPVEMCIRDRLLLNRSFLP